MSQTPVITNAFAWGAFDSRATPTVACKVSLSNGGTGIAVVPSGASTGRHEAFELRDGGARFKGRGVEVAVRNVNTVLRETVLGADPRDQASLDRSLRDRDGTENLSSLGANAVLAVSIATALAVADGDDMSLYRSLLNGAEAVLPLPMINIISGGAHAGGAVDIQDVLVIPVGAHSFREAIEFAWEVREATQDVVRSAGAGLSSWLVADEGGVAGDFASNADAIEAVIQGIERAGLRPGTDVAIALDVAANQLRQDERGIYVLPREHRELTSEQMAELVVGWCDAYPIVSVEDPLAEDDWPGWRYVSSRLRNRVQLVGDDLLVTDATRLETAVGLEIANAILIKPNQAGTLSAARKAVELARGSGYSTVVSARSGDTEDAWLADLAVGWSAGQIKVGSTHRSERLSKYNRLLAIEAEDGDSVRFAGAAALASFTPTR